MNMSRCAQLLMCLMFGVTMTTSKAGAQICAAPLTLSPNTPTTINTCLGDSLGFICNLFDLDGPAAIVRMPLPYPVGTITVQSLNAQYDPALFLLRSHCNGTATCGFLVDSGQTVETLNLELVDSGDYFLAIAPFENFSSISCAPVLITYSVTAAQQAAALEGIFRGGLSAPPAIP